MVACGAIRLRDFLELVIIKNDEHLLVISINPT